MNVGRRNAVRGMVAAAILGFIVFDLLVVYAPDAVAFSPNNYGWNGLSDVFSVHGVNFTISLSTVPARSVLVIMQPSVNFTSGDAAAVFSHLQGGGTVLVADKSGAANSLLGQLGSGMMIENRYTIFDPIYNWKAKNVPTALVLPGAASKFPYVENVSGIALNQPSPLLLQKRGDTKVAITSPLSYEVALPNNSTRIRGGFFVVAAAEKVGNGTLFVIGDSQFFLNSEWTIAGNSVLIRNMFGNASVYIDASHWATSPLTSSNAQLRAESGEIYAFISGFPMRYVTTALVVAVALALVPGSERGVKKPTGTRAQPTVLNRDVSERPRKGAEENGN